mgnify:CR=1 FL=1
MEDNFLLPPPPPGPDPLLTLSNVSLSFDPASTPPLSAINLTVRPGMRLLLHGPIASGKSTLLHGLAGRLLPLSGTRTTGRWVQMLLWDQTAREGLGAEEESPLQFVQRGGSVDESAALETLLSLGLDPWAARRPCCCLSSGERTLVALASIALIPRHLLLLDNPTVFLGAAAARRLVEALAPERWSGALVVSSSSRAFCEALHPTHVAQLCNGTIHLLERPPCAADWPDESVDNDWVNDDERLVAVPASTEGKPPPDNDADNTMTAGASDVKRQLVDAEADPVHAVPAE